MVKEPEYYGIGRYVNEGPAPVNNFQYLEDLTHHELFLTGTRAFHRRDIPLERAADEAMRKKYLNFVNIWLEEVDNRKSRHEDFLVYLSEIVRLGVNFHQKDLIDLWPHLKERADMLSIESRLNPNRRARIQYSTDCEIVEALKEQIELEMMRYG